MTTHRRPCWRRLLAAVSLLAGLAGLAGAQGITLALDPLVTGLARPLALANAGDGSGRLFIAEQAGPIWIWNGSQLESTPFLDIDPLTTCCGERGLLGLVFDPDYETNGYFYVSYTDLGGGTVIARYSVSAGNPDVADPASALILLEEAQPASNHNNGHLAFGPDGYLYVGMGDGGSGSAARGQDLTSLLGKILRIDPDGDDFPEPNRNYAIPAGNPFVGNPAAQDEIWAYGLRNPWRFSFDRQQGDLWIGDVGQFTLEEIDFQPAASAGGDNYGWSLMEGNSCFDPPTDCNDGSLTLPVLEYAHGADCSVTGGYRYRGGMAPRLRGVYLYGDYCSGILRGTVPTCDAVIESRDLLTSGLRITSFGEDESGEVYVTDHNNDQVLRLTTTGTGGPTVASSTPTLDYGMVAPATLVSLPITLTNTNTGLEAAIIEGLEPTDAVVFSLDLGAGATPCGPLPICLPPGESCTAEVDFSSLGGTFTEQLRVEGNFPAVPVALLAQVACGGPNERIIDQATFDSTAELVACQRLTLGPAVVLEAGADVAARAGIQVQLVDGVTVEAGARLRIQNDPSLLP